MMQDRHQRTALPFPQLSMPWLEILVVLGGFPDFVSHVGTVPVDQAMTYAEKCSIAASHDSTRHN